MHIKGCRGLQEKFAFTIDSKDQGIWLNSGRQFRMIYIPFSMLEITCKPGIINFKYRNAFYYTRKGKMRMLRSGNEHLRMGAVDEDELKNFVIRFNQLTSKQRAIILAEQDPKHSMLRFESVLGGTFLLLGVIATIFFNPALNTKIGNVTKSDTSSSSLENKYSSDFKEQDLKFGQKYTTKDMNITINKGYRAKTDQGRQVVIFNITLSGKKDSPDVQSDNFYITSDKDILSDGENFAETPLKATTLLIDGKKTPVVNQLNDYENYCDPSWDATKKLTYNIVLGLTDTDKTNYFIYSDFGLQDPPDESSNTPAYIWKFAPQKLEVLQ